MTKAMQVELRNAIKDSEQAGPKHGVVISKTLAKRLLYRLIKEESSNANSL